MDSNRNGDGMGDVSPIPGVNSHPQIHPNPYLTPNFSVSDWGFDTVSIGFFPKELDALEALSNPTSGLGQTCGREGEKIVTDLDGDPVQVTVKASGNWTMSLGFATILGYPSFGSICVEGRASAILARSSEDLTLVRPDRIADVEGAALRLVWSALGRTAFSVCKPTRFRRWDLTVDLRNEGVASEGRRTLEALAAVRLPYWCGSTVHKANRRDDLVAGASWPADGRKQFRAYDKGVELSKPKHRQKDADGEVAVHPEACAAGSWLRLERQMRPTNGENRLTAEELTASDLRGAWLGRWATSLKAPSLSVCSTSAALLRLSEQLSEPNSNRSKIKRLVAETAAAAECLAPELYGSHQDLAHVLREQGIVLAAHLPAWQSVELQPLLQQAADVWQSTDQGQEKTLASELCASDPESG